MQACLGMKNGVMVRAQRLKREWLLYDLNCTSGTDKPKLKSSKREGYDTSNGRIALRYDMYCTVARHCTTLTYSKVLYAFQLQDIKNGHNILFFPRQTYEGRCKCELQKKLRWEYEYDTVKYDS